MMEHLTDSAKAFLIRSTDEERIQVTKKFKWIGYSEANNILKKLNDLIRHPIKHRMPNILLIGESNNGKTALLNKFLEINGSTVNETTGELNIPVIMIQAPPEPDEKRFYESILNNLFAPYRDSERTSIKQKRVIQVLKKVNTRVLIIDEIHHVLAGSLGKQRLFLNVIKYLSNELKVPLIGAGTMEALNAISTDKQLSNRFKPTFLEKWEHDEDYLRLLASFERILPLKFPSQLTEKTISDYILMKSGGLIGEISQILESSCILAIESGVERINMNILKNIDYQSPDERRKTLFRT
ncbi:MAG: AAA family ATPase [Thaumarchaeota archaeon]|nr:AAA family ATPase [Nitrososphaerota archaeon]